jgi:hypothetical protein
MFREHIMTQDVSKVEGADLQNSTFGVILLDESNFFNC